MPSSKPAPTLAAATKTKCAPTVTSTRSESASKAASKLHKRSRSGCFTCRLRRKKCDEGHPSCKACINLNLKCEYKRPMWWASAEQRRMQKERVKNKIKHTKTLERRGSQENGEHTRLSQTSPSLSGEGDFTHASFVEPYDPFINNMPTTTFATHVYPTHYAPYEIDVRTERQTFVNDVPLRHDSSVSTYSAMGPPQLHATLPTFHADEWLKEECFNQTGIYGQVDPSIVQHSNYSMAPYIDTAAIPVDDHDRAFLDHFVDNVLRMIFPIIEVHQLGAARARSILRSLETNKSYLHCCLSVSAIHLKTTVGLSPEQIDHDIMRHRYEAIAQLCQALNHDTEHEQILDATLAMIFFHCSVGAPDDCLPDIPWDDHFQAASNLVHRLELPNSSVRTTEAGVVTPFSMSLTTWIDILGATMLGTTPQFAHSYRSKHLTGTPSGLRELMGCDDRIMYLISEIACLDSLKSEGRIDEITLCQHVSALGAQLEHTEPADPTLAHPYTPSGTFRPDLLTKSMSAIFRIAARIYLCSLVPGFDRNQPSNVNLVLALTNALQFIPAGPYGFDRSLVWPLLMAGAFSTPESTFRSVLEERSAALGEIGDFGSFGRMYRVLHEVWRLADDCSSSDPLGADQISANGSNFKQEVSTPPELGSSGMRLIKKQNVHWRDIMHRNGWRYLLL